MSNKITAGEKIRLARAARKLTVREFGKLLGMTGGWVSQIENGQLRLKLDQYEQIQAVLGFRFDTPEAEAAFSYFLKPFDLAQDVTSEAANGHS